MKRSSVVTFGTLLVGLTACDRGNLKSAADYHPPPPPPIAHPAYNPYAAYGDANAIWQPPVINRNGSIVKPEEPATEWDRPNYESAPWATGGKASPFGGPPGTF
jgi:hypothetical protein